MEKKKVIKRVMNVLGMVMVGLVSEGKGIKEDGDVEKVSNGRCKGSWKRSSGIWNKAWDVKE